MISNGRLPQSATPAAQLADAEMIDAGLVMVKARARRGVMARSQAICRLLRRGYANPRPAPALSHLGLAVPSSTHLTTCARVVAAQERQNPTPSTRTNINSIAARQNRPLVPQGAALSARQTLANVRFTLNFRSISARKHRRHCRTFERCNGD